MKVQDLQVGGVYYLQGVAGECAVIRFKSLSESYFVFPDQKVGIVCNILCATFYFDFIDTDKPCLSWTLKDVQDGVIREVTERDLPLYVGFRYQSVEMARLLKGVQ